MRFIIVKWKFGKKQLVIKYSQPKLISLCFGSFWSLDMYRIIILLYFTPQSISIRNVKSLKLPLIVGTVGCLLCCNNNCLIIKKKRKKRKGFPFLKSRIFTNIYYANKFASLQDKTNSKHPI